MTIAFEFTPPERTLLTTKLKELNIVDGSTIQWEQYKEFDGLSDEEISTLLLKEYEEHERQRMEKNAWHCAGEFPNELMVRQYSMTSFSAL